MSHDIKRLLAGCDAARLKTDVKLQVAKLNDWTTTYLKGLDAAQKISEAGYGTLIEAQKELALSLDDFLRFEGEGGNAEKCCCNPPHSLSPPMLIAFFGTIAKLASCGQ